jgi:hypothetical protein
VGHLQLDDVADGVILIGSVALDARVHVWVVGDGSAVRGRAHARVDGEPWRPDLKPETGKHRDQRGGCKRRIGKKMNTPSLSQPVAFFVIRPEPSPTRYLIRSFCPTPNNFTEYAQWGYRNTVALKVETQQFLRLFQRNLLF